MGNLTGTKRVIVLGVGALAACLLLIMGVLFVSRASDDPADTVIAFSEYFNSGEYKKMLHYIEPSEAKLIRKGWKYVPDAFAEPILEVVLPFLSDATSVKLYPEIVEVQAEKKRAVVTVKFRKLDDENLYDVYLSRKNGFWYVSYVMLAD